MQTKTQTKTENPSYLSQQLITYIGNKRALLPFIGTALDEVRRRLGKDKLIAADIFAGSGVVSRYLKAYSSVLYANDLEGYAQRVNQCYLANREQVDMNRLSRFFEKTTERLSKEPLRAGFITELYSPQSDRDIKSGERVFYTRRNAMYIDTARQLLEEVPEPFRTYLLGPLLCEASVHTNTSGVFKGFYKSKHTGIGKFGGDGQNALSRIMGDIELKLPVFSEFSCETHVTRRDANELAGELPEMDLAYIDPPYNEHPYGSNYFMLNLINDYERPADVSKVSGIPKGWNRSRYNRRREALAAMQQLCTDLKASHLLISFSDEGFISKEDMVEMLEKLGDVCVLDKEYNTFRGSRNLSARDIHVREYLYLVEKR